MKVFFLPLLITKILYSADDQNFNVQKSIHKIAISKEAINNSHTEIERKKHEHAIKFLEKKLEEQEKQNYEKE